VDIRAEEIKNPL